jgi:hypothetical protein
MRQASKRVPDSAEKTVRDIRRATRRHHSASPPIALGQQAYSRGKEVATASVLATTAKAAAPRVSVIWSVLVGIVLATRAHARARDPDWNQVETSSIQAASTTTHSDAETTSCRRRLVPVVGLCPQHLQKRKWPVNTRTVSVNLHSPGVNRVNLLTRGVNVLTV